MSDALALVIQRAVRAERARIGISQAELAKRLSWSRSRVAAMETGARRIYAHELPELCRALEIQLPELLTRASAEDRRWLGVP
ncbi:MAG: helix-turn-helix transcriptional regulator [Actinomycetota bacterium]|nr:helix-turn-helix transcriptional regulator [Actinomycetota bacterium]